MKRPEKNFVAFEAAVIDTNDICAAVELTQQVKGNDGQVSLVPVTAIQLYSGGTIKIGGPSREKFINWWKQNVSMDIAELPPEPASEAIIDIDSKPPVENVPPMVQPVMPEPPAPPLPSSNGGATVDAPLTKKAPSAPTSEVPPAKPDAIEPDAPDTSETDTPEASAPA